MKYIYQHMGLGDHVLCNGLVRTLMNENESYKMFVKPHNLTTVKFMYRDLPNLDFIVGDDYVVRIYMRDNLVTDEQVIWIGFCQIPLPGAKNFDDSFYLQHNVPFEKRWSAFKVDRDLESEKRLFEKFNVKEGEYVFVHDDGGRNFSIDYNHIVHKNLPIVRPVDGYTDNVFDYCYLMEHSVESHFIDSSFILVFESLALRDTYIYKHLTDKNFFLEPGQLDETNQKLNFIKINNY